MEVKICSYKNQPLRKCSGYLSYRSVHEIRKYDHYYLHN
jgi:hypothetical protein